MGKEISFILKRGSEMTSEEKAMIEAASVMPEEYD